MGSPRKLVAGTALAVLASVVPTPAATLGPPRAVLRAGSHVIQQGRPMSWCWTRKDGGDAVTLCADGTWSPPPASNADSGSTLSIVLYRTQRPAEVHLSRWLTERTLDPRPIEARLRRAGEYWKVEFQLTDPCAHHYLHLSARWPNSPRYHTYGGGVWQFHVTTRAGVASPLGNITQDCGGIRLS